MTCRAVLVRPSDNKVLKEEFISEDTYSDIENIISKRNIKTYKDERFWTITHINV